MICSISRLWVLYALSTRFGSRSTRLIRLAMTLKSADPLTRYYMMLWGQGWYGQGG